MDARILIPVAILSGVGGAGLFQLVVGSADRERPRAMEPAAPGLERGEDLQARLISVEERLGQIAAERDSNERRTAPVPDEALAERMAALEQRLARFEAGPIPAGGGRAIEATTETAAANGELNELLSELGGLNSAYQEDARSRRTARIQVLRELLERYPDRAEASAELSRLVGELIANGERDQAEEELNRFAEVVAIEGWEEAQIRGTLASAARDYDAARGHYRSVANDPSVDGVTRADAEFWVAYAFRQEGLSSEAVEAFQSLVDRYGHLEEPELRPTIDGAIAQLELLGGGQ